VVIFPHNPAQWAKSIPIAFLAIYLTSLPALADQPAESPDPASAKDSPDCKMAPSSDSKCKCCPDPGKVSGELPDAAGALNSTPREEKFGTELWPGRKSKPESSTLGKTPPDSLRPVSVVPV
jgi:hypothetical protein